MEESHACAHVCYPIWRCLLLRVRLHSTSITDTACEPEVGWNALADRAGAKPSPGPGPKTPLAPNAPFKTYFSNKIGPERTNREAPGAAAIGGIADIGL
jgi:hypothetical protein